MPVLEQIRQAGKTRFIGISSSVPHLLPFIDMDVFDVFQVPYSELYRTHEEMIQYAMTMGAGLIIRGGSVKGRRGEEMGWVEWDRAELDDLAGEMSRYEFVMRFTLSHVACHTIIIGTTDLDHLRANASAVQAGPLPVEIYEEVKKRLPSGS